MNQVVRNIAAALLLASLCGCSQKHPTTLEPGSYVAYVEEDGSQLKTTIRSGIWAYSFQYKPSAYIALKETEVDHIDKAAVLKRIGNLNGTVWFNIAIRVNGKSLDPLKYEARDLNEYNSRLNYFLSQASANFHLSYGNEGDMPQIGYYFENNYSIKPEVVAVVGFRIPDTIPAKNLTLEYTDELFNAGILKFRVPASAINSVPTLSI